MRNFMISLLSVVSRMVAAPAAVKCEPSIFSAFTHVRSDTYLDHAAVRVFSLYSFSNSASRSSARRCFHNGVLLVCLQGPMTMIRSCFFEFLHKRK